MSAVIQPTVPIVWDQVGVGVPPNVSLNTSNIARARPTTAMAPT